MATPTGPGPGPEGGGGNVRVVVRVRPFTASERDRNAQCIVQMKHSQTILSPTFLSESKSSRKSLDTPKTFAFDKSYWSFDDDDTSTFAGQGQVFEDLGKPLLDNAFQGYNNCIFAYGQTGSGKSYSMMGTGTEPGIIPRICKDMYSRIGRLQTDPNLTSTVEVSYLEIYNERVRDLLNPATKANLKVREHPATGPYVEDLAKLAVRSFPEIQNLMDEGNKARTVAATNMNESSSRSHAVFTLTLTQTRHDVETNMDTQKVAKISLVDLAGSERAITSGATGARLKEGSEINKSLSTLGRVIAALADVSTGKKKPGSIVPYRDSILTWLLKDSLGGNSLTAMIAAISPADMHFDETLSTLRYADSAKRIKNHAVVNEDPNARMIRELKAELAQLRSKLGSAGSVSPSDQLFPDDTPLDKQFVTITQSDGTTKQVSKAEIIEQLSQSEKLYQDLQQTWEQKLQMTEQVHKEREAALEELGISIEKGFVGLSTPKRMPHLVNLSEDPLLAECLVYNLKPGTTTVGNADTSHTADIRLNGTNILHEHCSFENENGRVTIIAKPNAAIMVNGVRVETSHRLRTGFRVILGDFQIFRFNHPQEARAERDEGSKLKQSLTDSPSSRPAHHRNVSNISRTESEFEGDRSQLEVSPVPFRAGDHESDWSLARREAVSAALGPDQKMTDMTDQELDTLYEHLQRLRAIRRLRDRKHVDGVPDDESDSVSSIPQREKYLSLTDTFSLDTALTLPSTPQEEDNQAIRAVRDEMQAKLDAEKQDYQMRLQQAQASNLQIERIQAEKQEVEQNLKNIKDEMLKRLYVQKEQYNRELRVIREAAKERSRHPSGLIEREVELAKRYFSVWSRCNNIAMAASILRNAAMLKEAQVMSQHMAKNVVFQFVIVDHGHQLGSTYDLVMNDPAADDDDDDVLANAAKPCVGVRVVDFKHSVIHLWSLAKLKNRLRSMRQVYQYFDRPEYIKHFQLDNPFSDSCLPVYSRIGDADIPLSAVLDLQVKELSLDVISPYTFTIVGILRLGIEPSSAEAPSSTLKFNIVLQDLTGFSEREGTQVHAQMFFFSDSMEITGTTTSRMFSGFEDRAIVFGSVHSMSVALSSSPSSCLRVSVFARTTPTHLDKLLSWDDMRDSAAVALSKTKSKKRRHGEHAADRKQLHDVVARIRILELGQDGLYRAVDVVRRDTGDAGIYQLCQGLQRRVLIDVKGTSGASLPWTGASNIRIGGLHLIDTSGKVTDMRNEQVDVSLSLVSTPAIQTNRDYTTTMRLLAHWDCGAHSSALLDRPTVEGYRVQLTIAWEMSSVKLTRPLELSLDLCAQVLSRTNTKSVSLFSQLFGVPMTNKSTAGCFALNVIPISGNVGDLWRLDTRDSYIKGEESLNGWTPRGTSLVRDSLNARNQRRKLADVERTRQFLKRMQFDFDLSTRSETQTETLDERQTRLVRKALRAWSSGRRDAAALTILSRDREGVLRRNGTVSRPSHRTQLVATAHHVTKNPHVLRSGYLFVSDADKTSWERRFVELRRPYLHLYASSGEEVDVLNLSGSRIDHDPQPATTPLSGGVRRGADRPSAKAKLFCFVVYGATRTGMFAAANEHDKTEWIFAIDTSYYSSRPASLNRSVSDEE